MTPTAARLADYRTLDAAVAELRAIGLRASVSGLYKAIAQGLPSYKVPGGGRLICLSEYVQFIEKHRKVKESKRKARAAGTRAACPKPVPSERGAPGEDLLKLTGVKAATAP